MVSREMMEYWREEYGDKKHVKDLVLETKDGKSFPAELWKKGRKNIVLTAILYEPYAKEFLGFNGKLETDLGEAKERAMEKMREIILSYPEEEREKLSFHIAILQDDGTWYVPTIRDFFDPDGDVPDIPSIDLFNATEEEIRNFPDISDMFTNLIIESWTQKIG